MQAGAERDPVESKRGAKRDGKREAKTPFGSKSTAEEVSEGFDLRGRHALVTGASAGIGLETARVLALRGASVTMACRNPAKAEDARQRLVAESGGRIAAHSLPILQLDLASLASVRAFAVEFLAQECPIHFLVNNAGVMLPDRRETADGFEAHFGTNHLGHFLLTRLLLDRIRESAPSRIVNVSSEAMHFASLTDEFSDLNWEKRSFSGWRSYGDSKLMNLMFTDELNRRYEEAGISAVALHPGIVTTELARDQSFWMHLVGVLARPFSKAVDRGAATTLYAALRADPSRPGESYLADCAPARRGKLAGNQAAEARLWALSEELTGL